jgi:hypothetical protein
MPSSTRTTMAFAATIIAAQRSRSAIEISAAAAHSSTGMFNSACLTSVKPIVCS